MKRVERVVDVEVIEAELALYKRWRAAYSCGERPLPALPERGQSPKSMQMLLGLAVHLGLFFIGWAAYRLGLDRIRVWAAEGEIAVDPIWFEPGSCGLNHAYTRVGLGLLAVGNEAGAIGCLHSAWRVHPCAHNTSFGLDPRLWRALATVPAADGCRAEYEAMARRFVLDAEWPRPRRGLRCMFRRS